MLNLLDITQIAFDALNNAAPAVYEAVYKAVYEAVSEVDASHFSTNFHENSINHKWKIIFIKNQNSESENVQCMIFSL